MSIDRAIEIEQHRAEGGISLYSWKEEKLAAALAVEALKRLRDECHRYMLVPGETEEEP